MAQTDSSLNSGESFLTLAQNKLSQEEVKRYQSLRWNVFLGIFIGYAGYYLVRKNLAQGIPHILRENPDLTQSDLGTSLTALSVAYGLSKFFMGSLSDQSNPRYFMSIGLAISSLIMIFLGFNPWVYEVTWLLALIHGVNGWVQGMGWPAVARTLVHWYTTKERGMVTAVWNVSHNIGAFLMPLISLWYFKYLAGDVTGELFRDNWNALFYVNGFAGLIVVVAVLFFLRDIPEKEGLPAIERLEGYASKEEADNNQQEKLTTREIFLQVLRNKYVWYLSLANAFIYFVRYGVIDWVPTYLELSKGVSSEGAAWAWSIFEFSAIPGTILCGVLSDRVFQGKRGPATILYTLLTLAGVLLYWYNLTGPLWIDYTALFLVGFSVYGPVMMIGLHAMDLVNKDVAGTASGLTGTFGYVFGSAVAGWGVGKVADLWGWNAVFSLMVGCCIMVIICTYFTLDAPVAWEKKQK